VSALKIKFIYNCYGAGGIKINCHLKDVAAKCFIIFVLLQPECLCRVVSGTEQKNSTSPFYPYIHAAHAFPPKG
jgi:hypothetical protein